MENIQIGDKVRVIESSGLSLINVGEIYEVKDVLPNVIKISVSDGYRHYSKDRFERVNNEITMQEADMLITELFDIEDNVEENVMNKSVIEQAKVLELVNTWGAQDYKYEKQDLENRIKVVKRDIDEARKYIKQQYGLEKNLMAKFEALREKENETFDRSSDIKAICEHPSVLNIEAENNILYISTDYINIYDDKGNTFKGNKYRLRFDYHNMECKIFGEDEKYNRVSYWANNRGHDTEYLDPHPHVNGRNGDACWGSAGDMLTYSMNNYELYASYMIVYNFLQQTNLDDPAGRYIRNWDCIDDNERVIDNPYTFDHECSVCHCELEEDGEDTYWCDCCDSYMCSEHERWIESENIYVCDDCYDEHYFCCYDCGEYYHNNEYHECSECGNAFCNDCIVSHDSGYYCENCYDEKFETCPECGEVVEKGKIYECNDCDLKGCKDCFTFKAHNNTVYCLECYDENYSTCPDCKTVNENPDTFYCDLCEERYCYSCRSEHEVGANIICNKCKENQEQTNE